MAERDRFELELAAALRAYAEDAPTQVRPTELAHRFATAYPHRRMALGRLGLVVTPAVAWAVLLTGLLLTTALIGALIAGGLLPIRQVTPQPAIDTTVTPAPSAIASETPSSGLVAYTVIHCVPGNDWGGSDIPDCTSTPWLAAGDGSDARVLPAGGSQVLGWSADGSRLLVEGDAGLVLTDATGTKVAAVPIPCTDTAGGASHDYSSVDCPGAGDVALSPDGTRVAFVRSYIDNQGAGRTAFPTVVAVLDLTTGRSTELAATRTTNPPEPREGDASPWPCNASTKLRTCQGDDGNPRWSPDGRRIVFDRQRMSPETDTTWDSAAVYVIDADGANLRRVTPIGLYASGPSWAPDGTRLAFTTVEYQLNAGHSDIVGMKSDIDTIGSDGSGLRRLTTDGSSAGPTWTADGRLTFRRGTARSGSGGLESAFENWVMGADGADASRLGGTIVELTKAGCTSCVYVADPSANHITNAYWQPMP